MAKKAAKKKKCFIISPLGHENSETRRKADGLIDAVLKPVLQDMDFEVAAPLDIDKSGSITRQVIERILEDDLVVANLTEVNANVMYELAIRHCARMPVVILAERGTDLPFDIADERVLFYHNDMAGVEALKPDFQSAVESTLEDQEPDNPVYRAKQGQILKEVSAPDDFTKFLMDEIREIKDRVLSLDSAKKKRLVAPGSTIVYKDSFKNRIETVTVKFNGVEHDSTRIEILKIVEDRFRDEIHDVSQSLDCVVVKFKNASKAALAFYEEVKNIENVLSVRLV